MIYLFVFGVQKIESKASSTFLNDPLRQRVLDAIRGSIRLSKKVRSFITQLSDERRCR